LESGEEFFARFQMAGALVGQQRDAIPGDFGPTEREGGIHGDIFLKDLGRAGVFDLWREDLGEILELGPEGLDLRVAKGGAFFKDQLGDTDFKRHGLHLLHEAFHIKAADFFGKIGGHRSQRFHAGPAFRLIGSGAFLQNDGGHF
jgi:hypothetical protein